MRFLIQIFFIVLLSSITSDLYAKALYASTFNATIDCENPLLLDESTLIFLDEDIILDQECIPLLVIEDFLSTDSLTLDSRTAKQFIIGTAFDLGTIFPQGQSLILKGNVRLVIMKGIRLTMNGNTIICLDEASIEWL